MFKTKKLREQLNDNVEKRIDEALNALNEQEYNDELFRIKRILNKNCPKVRVDGNSPSSSIANRFTLSFEQEPYDDLYYVVRRTCDGPESKELMKFPRNEVEEVNGKMFSFMLSEKEFEAFKKRAEFFADKLENMPEVKTWIDG